MAAQIPARLGFLAIFNPTLARGGDDNAADQIVYYATIKSILSTQKRRRHRGEPALDDPHVSQEERNERLRQVGLARGMVEFAGGFASGKAMESVETERSRVLIHELEPDWWILVSVHLGQIPLPPRLDHAGNDAPVEYSSRDLKPTALLLQDLLRAHSIFLLNHDSSLSALFVRCRRSRFTALLSRYWDLFLSTWSVGLRGNPARDVFGGINLAASGELGVGVGEEDRGSGEREVLEGLIGRVEGLLDVVVSRFGSPGDVEEKKDDAGGKGGRSWLGAGQEPEAEDGAVFLGVGAVSRKSVRDITHWMEDMYTWGVNAYGVVDSPTSIRRARRPKRRGEASTRTRSLADADHVKDGNRRPTSQPSPQPKSQPSSQQNSQSNSQPSSPPGSPSVAVQTPSSPPPAEKDAKIELPAGDVRRSKDAGNGAMDKYVNYLKFGYGTYWSLGIAGESSSGPDTSPASPARKPWSARKPPPADDDAVGHYLIGLMGAVEEMAAPGTAGQENSNEGDSVDASEHDPDAHNSRTMLRTVHVELEAVVRDRPDDEMVRDLGRDTGDPSVTSAEAHDADRFDTHDRNKAKKLRVVVYINRPFVFTFLFALRTDSLAWDALYHSLHHQLAPLRKPLLASTAWRPPRPDVGGDSGFEIPDSGPGPGPGPSRIYDLVWDPTARTVRCSIPNVPSPGAKASGARAVVWTRADSLNTHAHLLGVFGATRTGAGGDLDVERTCKTNRGWWIVWSRVPERGEDVGVSMGHEKRPSQVEEGEEEEEEQEEQGDRDRHGWGDAGDNDDEDGGQDSSSRRDDGGQSEDEQGDTPLAVSKEIFLLRRASDHSGLRGVSGPFAGVGMGVGGSVGTASRGGGDGAGDGGNDGETAGRLAQGIGVDTRRYIEALLRRT